MTTCLGYVKNPSPEKYWDQPNHLFLHGVHEEELN